MRSHQPAPQTPSGSAISRPPRAHPHHAPATCDVIRAITRSSHPAVSGPARAASGQRQGLRVAECCESPRSKRSPSAATAGT